MVKRLNGKQDDKKARFGRKMTDILNYGALNLAMGIGYRSGLFEAMDGFDRPETAARIAEAAGLAKRYVKDWLGVMSCGGVVELSGNGSGEDLFFLPPEHGDFLAKRSGNNNLGVYTQEIPLLASCAMKPVLEGFRTGDGVEYEKYPEFQSFMSQLADAKHRQVLVNTFLPSVEKGRMVEKLREGIRVCDLGCAEGVALLLMAEAFPKSRFTGIDISGEVVKEARGAARKKSLANVEFFQLDAAQLEGNDTFNNTFDYVTAFDAIHDQTRPLEALKGVRSVLKPGGRFSMIDIAAESRLSANMEHPMGTFLYTVSLMHCMPVGLVENGAGLGMMWGKQKAVEMLEEAGFEDIRVLTVPEDSFNFHFFCKKPETNS